MARFAAASPSSAADFLALFTADFSPAVRLLPGVFFALLGSAGGGVMGLHPSATSSKRYSMPKGSVTRSSCCSSWGLPAGIFFLFTMTP